MEDSKNQTNKRELDSSSSDGSELDDVVDEVKHEDKLAEIQQLQQLVDQYPTQYQYHQQLIKELRDEAMFEDLEKSREHMRAIFPLDQQTWSEWLVDEMRLATSLEDHKKVIKLFELATEDYLCIPIWKMYLDYAIEQYKRDNEEGQEIKWEEEDSQVLYSLHDLKQLCDKAILNTQHHIIESQIVWKTCLDFELELLQKDTSNLKQIERVNKLYTIRFMVPHSEIVSNFEQYSPFVSTYYSNKYEEMMKQANSNYSKSKAAVEEREDFELELKQQCYVYEAYVKYINFETKKYLSKTKGQKDHTLIKGLFERTIQHHPLVIPLWERYLDFLNANFPVAPLILSISKRSVRNCSWSGYLWCELLRAMETVGSSLEDIEGQFHHCLGVGLVQSDPQEFLKVLLERCAINKRKLLSDPNSKDKSHEQLRVIFQDSFDTLQQICPGSASLCQLQQYWAHVEAISLNNVAKARKVWSDIMKANKNDSSMWLKHIDFELHYGEINRAQGLYKQGTKAVTDYPELIFAAFEQFERIYGTLDSTKQANHLIYSQRIKISQKYVKEVEQNVEKEVVDEVKKEKARVKDRANKAKQRAVKRKVRGEEEVGENKEEADSDSEAAHPKKHTKTEAEEPASDPDPTASNQTEPVKRHESSTLFVCNFKDLEKEHLDNMFSKFGNIVEIRKPTSKARKSRNFAYIQFSTDEEAQAASELDGKLLESGMPLSVKISQPKTKDEKKQSKKNVQVINPAILFITNLPTTYQYADVMELFKPCGPIKSIRLLSDANDKFKGSCFIEFEDEESSGKALAFNSSVIGERVITVAIADPKARGSKSSNDSKTQFQPRANPSNSTKYVGSKPNNVTTTSFMPRSATTARKPHLQLSSSVTVTAQQHESAPNSIPKGGKSNNDFRKMFLNKK